MNIGIENSQYFHKKKKVNMYLKKMKKRDFFLGLYISSNLLHLYF